MNFQAGDEGRNVGHVGRDTGAVHINAVYVGAEGGGVANVVLHVKDEGGYLLALQIADQLNVQLSVNFPQ